MSIRPLRAACLLALCTVISPLRAGTLIELSASASRPAANDLIRAQLYVEASASDPAEVARQVNQALNDALRIARAQKNVITRTGNQHAYPVFNREQKIESWRMRGELQLESSDSAALTTLVTQLQQMKLALGGISQQPSSATRKQVEESVGEDAIQAFQARASSVARSFGKAYTIKRLHISQEGQPQPMLRAAPQAMAVRSTPLALEAGESLISVSISGEIELAD